MRVYFVCRTCREGEHPLDDRLGIEGSLSRQAKRMVCLAGASWGYETASRNLKELTGLLVSGGTIRKASQEEGAAMARWSRDTPEQNDTFVQASGEIEFSTDGTSVNTTGGWREMRVALFSKRRKGEPASLENWDHRDLPAPHARRAIAAVESSDRFTSRWFPWAKRLGVRDASKISVLADGATWIWEAAATHFAGHDGSLDVFHALEHIAEAAKGLFKEESESTSWNNSAKDVLISSGWPGMAMLLHETKRNVSRLRWKNHGQPLYNYLARRAEQLDYPRRLREGLPIGSGQIEGACKNLVGRRLKQTGARWRVRRVNRMASLCALVYSDLWDAYWTSSA